MARRRRVPKPNPRPSAEPAVAPPGRAGRLHWVCVPALLIVAAVLAVSSLVGDSITFDETSHLTAGMSYLKHHDYRLAPDHPPLAKIWAAWPLLLMEHRWPSADTPSWEECRQYTFGQEWLCELNDPQRLLVPARCMMVVLLLGMCMGTYVAGRWLFGPAAGLLALVLAAFSPTLLAHGRLVTTDMPLTLCALLVLLAFARLLRGITWLRLLAAAAALGALSVVKFSWPLVLVGPLAMAIVALVRAAPLEMRCFAARLVLRRKAARGAALGVVVLILAVTTWAAIWSCYGWRYALLATDGDNAAAGAAGSYARVDRPPFQGGPQVGSSRPDDGSRGEEPSPGPSLEGRGVRAGHAEHTRSYAASSTLQTNQADSWQRALAGRTGAGLLKRVRLDLTARARAGHWLPEAYLYGLTWALHTTAQRDTYFLGQYAQEGCRSYFPVAFAIKTPVASMLLLLAGLLLVGRRGLAGVRDPLLLAGVVAFAVVYGLAAIFSNINIGQRHILPLYPLVFVFAGAAVGWWGWRPAPWLIGGAVAWLVVANLVIRPHYLSYFNELIGGPRRGHHYLADSNIDWGQDLKRLAAYLETRPEEPVQLAYFGSADPRAYGIECAALPSHMPFGAPADLTAGTYVLSVTQLLGVYDSTVRDAFWADGEHVERFRQLCAAANLPPPAEDVAAAAARHTQLVAACEEGRRKRLISRLRYRPPDERIGYSLFVYHLDAAEVAELTRP